MASGEAADGLRPPSRGLIDFAAPVAVVAVAVLHFPRGTQTHEVIAAFRSRMASGGYLVVSYATSEGPTIKCSLRSPPTAALCRAMPGCRVPQGDAIVEVTSGQGGAARLEHHRVHAEARVS